MIKGIDFTLNKDKLEKEYQLVELSEWRDFETKAQLGFHYTVMLPKMRFEKLKVSIKTDYPIISKEELEDKGQVTVTFEGLRTWASMFNGKLFAKAEATNIRLSGAK